MDLAKNKVNACFCMTEIAHGSNVQGIRTTATFDKNLGRFVFHTPDFEAAKAWVGVLAKTAVYAGIYAILQTKDDQGNLRQHGLHTFIVPIRDPVTLNPHPGVVIGDMGEKNGLNGLDNGFMMFNNYVVDKDCLLDKLVKIDERGEYSTPFKDPLERKGKSLGTLSMGRVGVVNLANSNAEMAVVIAVRYSGVRKQFGPEGKPEQPILEYQSQQCRLFPYLAACYIHHHFSKSLYSDYEAFAFEGKYDHDKGNAGREMHALSCAAKAWISWASQAAIQECREACGGHGYLKASRLCELRDSNDANCTYEGDNNVILQQTANWLMSLVDSPDATSPFGSAEFLLKKSDRLTSGNSSLGLVLTLFMELTKRLLNDTKNKVRKLQEKLPSFESKNQSQFFFARTLALVYVKTAILDRFVKLLKSGKWEKSEAVVLEKLALVYGLWQLNCHTSDLLRFGLVDGKQMERYNDEFIEVCHSLKDDAVTLADCMAPPDFILNSTLGHSSGDVYKQMQSKFWSNPNAFARADYWEQVTEDYRKSKL